VNVVIDDRLLIEELLVGIDRNDETIHTTMYWYYRACRAAVAGAGGHLSGPFGDVPQAEQQRAIASMLQLPVNVGLPEARQTVPRMVDVATRHPQLNLLNLEAVAAASTLEAMERIWLSPARRAGASGVLPRVLTSEGQNGWKASPGKRSRSSLDLKAALDADLVADPLVRIAE
jgi:hypothetical protein